jgi:hypothetical protein
MEVSGQLHLSADLPLGERTSGAHWIGGYVGPTVCLDVVARIKISNVKECKYWKQ